VKPRTADGDVGFATGGGLAYHPFMGPNALVRAGLLLGLAVAAACGDIPASTIDAAPDADLNCSSGCDPNATCNAGACVCDPGYEGPGQTCTDVNECSTANGGCHVDADCLNRPGTRECRCRPGFVGDGLSCLPVWELQDSYTGGEFAAPFDGFAAAVGTSFYFTRDGQNANTLLYSYDTVNGAFAVKPVTAVDEFCACGYGQAFVGGPNRLWMFGNDGWSYDPALDRWAIIPAYASSASRRGEAAGAIDPRTGRVYLVGGRPNETTASWANGSNNTYGDEPGVLPVGVSDASAWLVPEIDTLFVAGGRGTDGNQRRVYSHVLGSSLWTELPQLPADAQQTRGMGTHRGRLWVASDEGVHFFDLATRVWTSVGLPIGFQRAVSANGELWAITSTIGSGRIDVYKLVRTE
jgi:hypothetical protein